MIIRNSKKLYISIVFFILVMILNFSFPLPKGDFWIMSIPIKSPNGFNFIGVFSLVLLTLAIFMLSNSLEKYRYRMVFLALVIYSFLPILLVALF